MNTPPPTPEFSFSLRRRRMFERCPREYYLHYFAAAGGFDPDSPPAVRQLHFLKQLRSRNGFVRELLAAALRERLTVMAETAAEQPPAATFRNSGLAAPACRKLYSAFNRMLLGAPLHDHKLPFLRELHYRETPPRQLLEELREQLAAGAALLDEAPEIRELATFPATAFHQLPQPAAIRLGSLTLYASPLLLVRRRQRWRFYEFGAPEAFTAMFHKYYALQEFRLRPEQSESCFIDLAGRRISYFDDRALDVTRELGLLRECVEKMSLIHSLPECSAGSACRCCRFRESCGKLAGEA